MTSRATAATLKNHAHSKTLGGAERRQSHVGRSGRSWHGRSWHLRSVALAVVAATIGAAAVLIAQPGSASASSTVEWCAGEVATVAQFVAPVQARLGGQITLIVATNAAEKANLVDNYALGDATGVTTSFRRGDGPRQITVGIDCTQIRSRRQRTALRFLALHEFSHALQFAFQTDPFAQTPDDHEHEADCAANVLMRVIYNTRLRMSYGAHGGCPAERFEDTWTWLMSLGIS